MFCLVSRKKTAGILLTGDGKLRKLTSNDGIEVRGILYVFDQLLAFDMISLEVAIQKIEELYKINTRLPLKAKEERIERWKNKEFL